MAIDTSFLTICADTLKAAHAKLGASKPGSIEYNMYRSACVKEFEIILEQSGNILRKAIRPYLANSAKANTIVFKDVFRYALKHGLLDVGQCERWLKYRDVRNDTAHLYGANFAEETLELIPEFISDTGSLIEVISNMKSER